MIPTLPSRRRAALLTSGTALALIFTATAAPAQSSGAPAAEPQSIVTRQTASGAINTTIGNQDGSSLFAIIAHGGADGAAIASDGNATTASIQGNRADAGIGLSAGPIASTRGSAPLARIVVDQASRALDLAATTISGTQVEIAGNLTGSRLSASQNKALTEATANRTDNRLTATTAQLDGGSDAAWALVDGTNVATAQGGLSMNSVQDYGTSEVRAAHIDARTALALAGDTDRSTLTASGNSTRVAATGNDASSLAQIDASDLASSIAVNGMQTGNGGVTAELGTTGAESGTRVVPYGAVTQSTIAVRDNRNLASAIGNLANQGADVTAATLAGSGARGNSGAVGEAYGASGDIALATYQKLGEPTGGGALIPKIEARAITGGGIAAQGAVIDSELSVTGNVQQATAIGNMGANRLSVAAANLGSEDAPASTALASFQYGQAAISATSQAPLLLRGNLQGSTARIEDNRNTALAVMNDADNRLSIDAVSGASNGAAHLESTSFGPPEAHGDHVLTSQQFAAGSVTALASGRISGGGGASGPNGSSWRIAGNQTQGEASANRAVNAVSLDLVDGAASAGLANDQVNTADTQASVTGIVGLTVPTAQAAATGSDIAIETNGFSALARGNVAYNSMTVGTGPGSGDRGAIVTVDPSSASVQAGVALLNAQNNLAPVTASVSQAGFLVPLNAGIDASRVALTGNDVAASAYGNSATNSLTLSGHGMPAGAIASLQVNQGNVTTSVTGHVLDARVGGLGTGSLGVSGNQISATAVGNQVSSAITALR